MMRHLAGLLSLSLLVSAASGCDGSTSAICNEPQPLAAPILDPSFNGSGWVIHSGAAGGSRDVAWAVAVDPQDRVIAAGYSYRTPPPPGGPLSHPGEMAIWRYAADGSPDSTFGGQGYVVHGNAAGGDASDTAWSVAIDSLGRIVATGHSTAADATQDMAIWRYSDDGSLDASFGGGGFVVHAGAAGGTGHDHGGAVAIDVSDRIVVAGWSVSARGDEDMVIWRYDVAGSLDGTFGGQGFVVHDNAAGGGDDDGAETLALDASGRIVAAGFSSPAPSQRWMTVWRYDDLGALDATLGGQGFVTHPLGNWDRARSVAIDPAGRILLAGMAQEISAPMQIAWRDGLIWRLLDDGSLDGAFGASGLVRCDLFEEFHSIALDASGRIVAVGDYTTCLDPDMAVLRLGPGGILDTTFGGSGWVIHGGAAGGRREQGRAVTLDGQGRIVVGGFASDPQDNDTMAIWRLLGG